MMHMYGKFIRISYIWVLLVILAMFVVSSEVVAGKCEIKYDRTPCPGKEKISYRKCKGNKTCSKFKEVESLDMCQAKAIKACTNIRLSITKSKVINAEFEGKPIISPTGNNDFCIDYIKRDKEYNKCG